MLAMMGRLLEMAIIKYFVSKKCFGCGERGYVELKCPEKSKSAAKSDDRSTSDKSKPKRTLKDTKTGVCGILWWMLQSYCGVYGLLRLAYTMGRTK